VNENTPISVKTESGPKWVAFHIKIQYRKGMWVFYLIILCLVTSL